MFWADRWFRILVGVGFVANMVFAVPAFFAPRMLEQMMDIGVANSTAWLRNVGILLIILSATYIPVIMDPFRYIILSGIIVAGRFSAAMFFLALLLAGNHPDGFWTLAITDLSLSLPQAFLLVRALKAGDSKRSVGG